MEIAQWLGRSDACGTRGTTTYHRNAHRTTYVALNCDQKSFTYCRERRTEVKEDNLLSSI